MDPAGNRAGDTGQRDEEGDLTLVPSHVDEAGRLFDVAQGPVLGHDAHMPRIGSEQEIRAQGATATTGGVIGDRFTDPNQSEWGESEVSTDPLGFPHA